MELREVIGPHQPNKPHTGIQRHQPRQSLRRVARAKLGFEARHLDARIMHHLARPRDTTRHRRGALLFQRVTRAYQPPHTVQPKAPQRLAGDMRMALMRRIERSAEQTDFHTGSGKRKSLSHT